MATACLSSSKPERRRAIVDCRHWAKCILFLALQKARCFNFKFRFAMPHPRGAVGALLMTFCCSKIRIGGSDRRSFYRTTFEGQRRHLSANLFCWHTPSPEGWGSSKKSLSKSILLTRRRRKTQKLSFTNPSFTNDTATTLLDPCWRTRPIVRHYCTGTWYCTR